MKLIDKETGHREYEAANGHRYCISECDGDWDVGVLTDNGWDLVSRHGSFKEAREALALTGEGE